MCEKGEAVKINGKILKKRKSREPREKEMSQKGK